MKSQKEYICTSNAINKTNQSDTDEFVCKLNNLKTIRKDICHLLTKVE